MGRKTTRLRRNAALAAVALLAVGCLPASSPRTPDSSRNAAACASTPGHNRPLIVDWPAPDRAALEALASRQVIVVRREGCELEVLRDCKAPASYRYISLTPKRDRIVIRDTNELFATVPVGAAGLEGKLASSGMLSVDLTVVGIQEAERSSVRMDELIGGDACRGATHVIATLASGAFELSAGGTSETQGGVGALGVSTGGKVSSSHETLRRDGDVERCATASGEGATPMEGCRALIRLELLKLGAPRPTCADNQRWNGEACELLAIPVSLSADKRAALRALCGLGVTYACKAVQMFEDRK